MDLNNIPHPFQMAGINPPTIPVALQRLFADAGFLSCAEDDQKPCISTRTYAHKDSWWDWGTRRWNRENPDRTKNFIRSTCEEIAQNIQQYTDTDFYEIILTKMIKLRTGLVKIAETYKSDVSAKDHITDSIMLLDMKIPERIKVTHGFSTINRPQVAPLGRGVIMTSSMPALEIPALGVSRGPIPTVTNGAPPLPVTPPPPLPNRVLFADAVPQGTVSVPTVRISPLFTSTPALPLPNDLVDLDPARQE